MPLIASSATPRSAVDYTALQSAIGGWAHREDLATFNPDFVRLAEADIRNDVRCRAMEAEATGTVVSYSITQPTDMIELRRLSIDEYVYSYLEPVEFAELQRQDSTDYVFTAIGQTFRVLTGTSYSIVYWAPLTELVAGADTNWLLQNAMDVYLWGCLKYSAIYAENDAATAKFQALYGGAVQRVNAREAKAMRAGGRMIMATEVSAYQTAGSILEG